MAQMERAAPVRKSQTSTTDLLSWPQQQADGTATPSPAHRSHQPLEAFRKVVFEGQVTEEESDSLNKRKPCLAPKWKEMSGSDIFAGETNRDAEDPAAATPGRAASRNYQRAGCFGKRSGPLWPHTLCIQCGCRSFHLYDG